jgi:hypothetical protein
MWFKFQTIFHCHKAPWEIKLVGLLDARKFSRVVECMLPVMVPDHDHHAFQELEWFPRSAILWFQTIITCDRLLISLSTKTTAFSWT